MKKHNRKYQKIAFKTGMAPTKERHQHSGGVIAETITIQCRRPTQVRRYRAVWDCPLDAYKSVQAISGAEYRAGLQFREAYQRAVYSRGAEHERLSRFTGLNTELTESEHLVEDALRALPPYTAGTVIDVCGHDRIAESQQEIKALKAGLGRLASCWGMAAAEITRPADRKG